MFRRRRVDPATAPPADVRMTLVAAPGRWPVDEACDVRLLVTFENAGAEAVVLYPGAARWSAEAGWDSPAWALVAEGSPPRSLIQLRTYHGPPGMPPTADYLTPHRQKLAPGRRHEVVLGGCWLPAACLSTDSLSRTSLDPEGMDGYTPPPAGTGVLALGTNRAALEAERAQRPDFLRPGLLLFVPPGPLRLRLRYQQRPWREGEPVPLVAQAALAVAAG
jgi:hypothetical protein